MALGETIKCVSYDQNARYMCNAQSFIVHCSYAMGKMCACAAPGARRPISFREKAIILYRMSRVCSFSIVPRPGVFKSPILLLRVATCARAFASG